MDTLQPCFKKTTKLLGLLTEGIVIRLHGRFGNAEILYVEKYPILL